MQSDLDINGKKITNNCFRKKRKTNINNHASELIILIEIARVMHIIFGNNSKKSHFRFIR